MAQGFSEEPKKLLIGLALVAVVVAAAFSFVEFFLDTGTKAKTYYWIQILSGTSWPDWKSTDQLPQFPIVVAATIHTLITAGPFLGVLWIVFKLLSTRSVVMTVAQVLRNRDRSIKFEITGVLARTLQPADKQRVTVQLNEAFERADALWKEDLKVLVGEEKAAQIVAQIANTKLAE